MAIGTTYRTTGGGNLTSLYSLTSSWAVSTLVVDLAKKFTTQFTGHEKSKNLEAVLTHESFDSTVIGAASALFDTYLSSTSDDAEEKYENGVNAKASSNPAELLLAITYSGPSNESTPKRLVRCFVAQLKGGGYTMEADGTIRVETTLTAVPPALDVVVGSATFETTLVSGATDQTITANTYGTSAWMTSV